MKGIKCCAECADYSLKKHKCTRGAKDPGKATDSFYADCPLDDAEPVRSGRWNYRHEDDWCYCTACGVDAEGSGGECLETDYCPHCGAKMNGDDKK